MKRRPKRSRVRSMRRMSITSLPRPKIMSSATLAAGFGSSLIHDSPHAANRALQPPEDGLSDQEVSNIELDDGRDHRDLAHRLIAEAVSGMALEPKRFGMPGGAAEAFNLAFPCRPLCLAISAGVQLYHGGAQLLGGVELARIGLDEERDPDAGSGEPVHVGRQGRAPADGIETTFGG